MPKLPWVERRFTFPDRVELSPEVIDRFRGTPARLEEKVRGLPREILICSDGGWTILQNIGHLLDLEPLWDGRLDDFLAGRAELRAADITNAATNRAPHNERELGDLTEMFRRERERQASKLDSLPESSFSLVSVHPRLKMPLRLVDAVTFVCLHDDYHLARIQELKRKFTPDGQAARA